MKFKPRGIIPPHITPFSAKEEIDEEALRRDVDFWIESGLHGLVSCGSNGEAPLMTERERIRVLEIVLDQTNGKIPVIAGTGNPGTKTTINLTKEAADLGVDATLIVTPFYFKPSQEELYEHYSKIASAVDIPIILYNVPKFTGLNMEPWIVEKLSEFDNIVGIKDSSGNVQQIQELTDLVGDQISVMAGSGNIIYSTLTSGGHGAIVAVANVIPKLVIEIYDSFLKGDIGKARRIQSKILRLNEFLTKIHGVPAVKESMNLLGLTGGYPRKPLTPLKKRNITKLSEILKQLNLL